MAKPPRKGRPARSRVPKALDARQSGVPGFRPAGVEITKRTSRGSSEMLLRRRSQRRNDRAAHRPRRSGDEVTAAGNDASARHRREVLAARLEYEVEMAADQGVVPRLVHEHGDVQG